MSSFSDTERRAVADAVHVLERIVDKIEVDAQAISGPDGAVVLSVIKTLRPIADRLRVDAERMPDLPRMTPFELLRRGGTWLGAARDWLKWNRCRGNGETVTFGSLTEIRPPLTARDVDDLAAHVAATLWPVGAPPAVMEAARILTRWHYGDTKVEGQSAVIVRRKEWDALRVAVAGAPSMPSATDASSAASER